MRPKEARADDWPSWRRPSNAASTYCKGAQVWHDGRRWVSVVDGNDQEPGVCNWAETNRGVIWRAPEDCKEIVDFVILC